MSNDDNKEAFVNLGGRKLPCSKTRSKQITMAKERCRMAVNRVGSWKQEGNATEAKAEESWSERLRLR